MLGEEKFNALANASVAIVGLGGVGGACAEALCRCGVGTLVIVDHDTVDVTNINRQLIATTKTVGEQKTDAWTSRLRSINPCCNVVAITQFYDSDHKDTLFSHTLDFVVDAIDTVSAKLSLAEECAARNINTITCLGTGNRLDPTQFAIGEICDTAGFGCGLARVMRQELKRRGLDRQPVLFSKEAPTRISTGTIGGRHSPASISFCPPVAGYIIASHVVKILTKEIL